MTSAPTIKTHEVDEPASLGEFCGICRRQVSRYTCPSCNLFYCSLSCFRSESHSQCSETFYRKEIETGIKSGSSKSEDDRKRMLEILKLIQEEKAADEATLFHPSDEENEEDSLTHRLSGIDISSASTNDLLRLLNQEEKDRFFSALRDPASGVVQRLLGSAEFQGTRELPWWEAPNDEIQSPSPPRVPYSVKPDLMVVPTNLINHTTRGTPLLYNICIVLLAYTYVTRHLSMSPLSSTNDPLDQRQARGILLQSAPFLNDRKSKLLHVSLAEAVISFWSRLDSRVIDKKGMVVLLEDVAKIVRPRRVIATARGENENTGIVTETHPFSMMIMVISDVCSLLSASPDSPVATTRGSSHVVMKLTFYAAQILSTSSSRFHALADEIHMFSERLRREAQ